VAHLPPLESESLDHQQIEDAIAGLRAAYAAFNGGDIESAIRLLDPGIEWIEPAEFPGGGTYHGIEGTKHILRSHAQVPPK
jgi:hypothetical protein